MYLKAFKQGNRLSVENKRLTAELKAKDERIDNLKEALERAHEDLTKNPNWPETRREHEISEIIEQALKENNG